MIVSYPNSTARWNLFHFLALFLKEETLSMIKTSQFYQLYSLALPFSEFLSCSVIIPGVLYWLTTAGRKEDYGHFQGFSTPRFMLQNPPFF